MQMIVAGGGTGGHFFPGLAVAEEAVRQGGSAVFVGSSGGIEARVAPRKGFRFVPLEVHGVRGSGWRGVSRFAFQFPLALHQAWRVIGETKADLVLGLGGYGSVPVVIGARLRGVPAVLMEQNAHPGMANRALAHLARRVCTTFAETEQFFPRGRAVRTGNPVRELSSKQSPDPCQFTIFLFGGSQGAHALNRAMLEAAPELRATIANLRIVHQTGSADREWVARAYRDAGVEAEVLAFVDDMASAYARADLVVCRAGATTLAELAAVGKPAILVPYPFAADDHQRRNAEVLVGRGAAEMILEQQLSGKLLAARISHYCVAREELKAMGCAATALATPEATSDVLRICREVARKES